MSGAKQGQGIPFSTTKKSEYRQRRLDRPPSGLIALTSAGLWILTASGRGAQAFVSPRPALTSALSLRPLSVHQGTNFHLGDAVNEPRTPEIMPGTGSEAHPNQKRRLINTDDVSVGPSVAKASRAAAASLLSAMLLGATAVVPTLTIGPEPAHATYSAYARREQDWSDRSESGQIQYSSARALKRQLREIAPMNTAKSLLFCPNGPSSNVSPLMENRCGDQLAAPSVFGRTQDAVGNSIPGFSSRPTSGDGLLTPASVGGFLPYGGGK